MRGDQLQHWSRYGDPDIHQHEVHWAIDPLQRFAQITFAQIDEAAQSRFLEMRPCGTRLLWLVFGANHHAVAASTRTLSRTAAARYSVETPKDVPASTIRRASFARQS